MRNKKAEEYMHRRKKIHHAKSKIKKMA